VQGLEGAGLHEGDGHQVEEAVHEARGAELAAAVRARAVGHRRLAHLEALPVGQRRQVAMQLAVDLEVLDDLAPVELEAAVHVVQARAGERAR